MSPNPKPQQFHLALHDFRSAHLQATLQGVLARITGRSNELLSYEEVASRLKLRGRFDRGIQTIPLDAIVGSVGRYTEFTRTFLPRRIEDQQRWANVKAVAADPLGEGFPPIEVYKVSDVYFVIDGNHRVSIARQEGVKSIEAHVIEIQTPVPLTPDVQPDELIIKAEYADFLAQTGLNRAPEEIDLMLSIPGGYQKLLDEICLRRCQLDEEGGQAHSLEASALSWYRDIYLPFAEAVRARGMLRWFPERTVADLYVWTAEHRDELENELGWSIRPEAAAEAVIQQRNPRAGSQDSKTGSWRKARLINRYSEHLFRDILVPLGSDPEGWTALEQAIQIAHREDAKILGLHVLETPAEMDLPEVQALREQFDRICEREKVRGSLAMEAGEPAEQILQRATLTDLIVLKVLHPPSAGIQALASSLRHLIARASRPILAVPRKVSHFERALLAFDGSPKAREALFVAVYLAEQWKTKLGVFIDSQDDKSASARQEYARNYLEFNEVEAEFLIEPYSPEVLEHRANAMGADLILMGGYSGSILKEMTVGSSVNFMLRASELPLFICH